MYQTGESLFVHVSGQGRKTSLIVGKFGVTNDGEDCISFGLAHSKSYLLCGSFVSWDVGYFAANPMLLHVNYH